MTWMMLAKMSTITHSLKCLGTGHLVTIIRWEKAFFRIFRWKAYSVTSDKAIFFFQLKKNPDIFSFLRENVCCGTEMGIVSHEFWPWGKCVIVKMRIFSRLQGIVSVLVASQLPCLVTWSSLQSCERYPHTMTDGRMFMGIYTVFLCLYTLSHPSVTWSRNLLSSNQWMQHHELRFKLCLAKHLCRCSLWWQFVRKRHLMTFLETSPAAFSRFLNPGGKLGNHFLLRWELVANG